MLYDWTKLQEHLAVMVIERAYYYFNDSSRYVFYICEIDKYPTHY